MSAGPAPLVLVVEDDPDAAAALAAWLAGRGYRVEAARDGYEAVAVFARIRPDLLVLDFRMPAATGGEVLQRVRRFEAGEEVPVIVCSGVSKFEIEMSISESPRVRLLPKPVDPVFFQRLLQDLLGQRALPAKA